MLARAGVGAGVAIVVMVGVALYLIPTTVGSSRKVVNIGSIFAIKLFFGWSLIGWVVALAMALCTNPPHAYPQYWQGGGPTPGAAVPPLGGYLPAGARPMTVGLACGHVAEIVADPSRVIGGPGVCQAEGQRQVVSTLGIRQ
jgi:hypothetical protein